MYLPNDNQHQAYCQSTQHVLVPEGSNYRPREGGLGAVFLGIVQLCLPALLEAVAQTARRILAAGFPQVGQS